MTKYCYSVLTGTTNIRLLRFDKESISKGDLYNPDEPLKISLSEVDLLHDPAFEALSYTWGDARNKVPIRVHGELLQITVHLDDFLRQLLQQGEDGNKFCYFWADQICINQESIPERNAQVALMAEIYRRSLRTLVWVNKADSDTEVVAKLLVEMDKLVGTGQTKLNEVIEVAHLVTDRFWRELESMTSKSAF
jgi:Heterokaryon incompatibility protein (HET)